MPMQIRRTATPNLPPAGLVPGQLGVEMADPLRLWVGVPTTVDPTGRRLLIPQGVSSGTAAPSATPSIGDLWYDTSTTPPVLKIFDGTNWVALPTDAPSDGTPYVRQNGAWVPLKLETMPGVTDGSEAAAGYVGEFMSGQQSGGNNGGRALINGQWVKGQFDSTPLTAADFQLLTLTPGDWDVRMKMSFSIVNPPMPGAKIQMRTNPPQDDPWDMTATALYVGGVAGITWGDLSIDMLPQRFNVTVNTPIYYDTFIWSQSGFWQYFTVFANARRMR